MKLIFRRDCLTADVIAFFCEAIYQAETQSQSYLNFPKSSVLTSILLFCSGFLIIIGAVFLIKAFFSNSNRQSDFKINHKKFILQGMIGLTCILGAGLLVIYINNSYYKSQVSEVRDHEELPDISLGKIINSKF